MTQRLTLEQLEELTGVRSRQIRELIRLDILPAPSSRGRGATYGPEHTERLLAWKRLRDEAPVGTTNEQLRALINKLASAGMLRGIADGTVPVALVDDGPVEQVAESQEDYETSPGYAADEAEDDAPAAIEMNRYYVAPAPPPAPSPPTPLTSARPRTNEEAVRYLDALKKLAAAPARLLMSRTTLEPTVQVDLQAAERSGASIALERLQKAMEALVAGSASSVRVNPARSEVWHRVAGGPDIEISARGPLTTEEIQLLEHIGQLLQQAIYLKER